MQKKDTLEIIYEDEHILIVNKAANMLSIPDRFNDSIPSVKKALDKCYDHIYVVHRLDRETSGIMCFAKTVEAHKDLSRQFQERTVNKYYLAIVEGSPSPAEGEINLPIAESSARRGKMLIKNNGKESLTIYKTLEKYKNYSLLSANIKTGRTHQIRVHFQAIGHPLAIDALYGRQSEIFLSKIKGRKFKLQKGTVEKPLMCRTTLHAYSLQFLHPHTGEVCKFEAEAPNDFNALLRQLRKWGGGV